MSHSSNLRRLFRRFDSNGDGFLRPAELGLFLSALGVAVPSGEAELRTVLADMAGGRAASKLSEDEAVDALRRRSRAELAELLQRGAARGEVVGGAPASLVEYGAREADYCLVTGCEEEVVRAALHRLEEEHSVDNGAGSDGEAGTDGEAKNGDDDDDSGAARRDDLVRWLHFESLAEHSAALLEDRLALPAGSLSRAVAPQAPYTAIGAEGRDLWAVLHVPAVTSAPLRYPGAHEVSLGGGGGGGGGPDPQYSPLPAGASPAGAKEGVQLCGLGTRPGDPRPRVTVNQVTLLALGNHLVITVRVPLKGDGRGGGAGGAEATGTALSRRQRGRRVYGAAMRLFSPLRGLQAFVPGLRRRGLGANTDGVAKDAPPAVGGGAGRPPLPRFKDPFVGPVLAQLHSELAQFPSELRLRAGRFLFARCLADVVDASWEARDTLRDWTAAVEEVARTDEGAAAGLTVHLYSIRSLAPDVLASLPPGDVLAPFSAEQPAGDGDGAAGPLEMRAAAASRWVPQLEGEALALSGAQNSLQRVRHDVSLIEGRCENLQELARTRADERMTRVLFVLTLVTSVFGPLSFLAGVYGMNWQHFPELEYKYGYAVFWAVCLAFITAMGVVFHRMRLHLYLR